MKFRTYGPLLIAAVFLAFVAWQARTGIFRRAHPGEPANKYMRQVLENPQTSEADAAILRAQFDQAHTNPSGLRYILRQPGEGQPPSLGALVVVHYDGFLMNGTKIDSSRDRGQPYSFRVGTGAVIKGWDEALIAMKKGEKRTLLIPWWLAYGESGKGPVPPKAMLRFEVELIDIR
jgi:FKBP-type peptidyl-prolyl cis-trans isomerase